MAVELRGVSDIFGAHGEASETLARTP